jgi:hypothetical protein
MVPLRQGVTHKQDEKIPNIRLPESAVPQGPII